MSTWIDGALSSITTAQYALQTIASLWQLTAHNYPPPVAVNDGAVYDYIVVGAGSAGAVVATRLSEDPDVTVLLLEAGGNPPLESMLPGGTQYIQNSYVDWSQQQHSQVDEYGYQCLKNKRQPVSHGKMLGGGSSMNLMMYMRGHPHNFNTWAEMVDDPSWRYENLLEYFMKTERLLDPTVLNSNHAKFHGTEGPVGVTKLWTDASTKYLNIYKEMGYDYVLDLNANGSLGFNEQMVTAANGKRQSTANAHLASAANRTNLHVLRHAHASKIIIDANKTARGVEFIDTNNNKTSRVYAKKEVIVSAGPINSPHLLLNSGIGPQEHLEEFGIPVVSDLPVGEKLINHHGVFLVYKTDELAATGPQPAVDPGAFPVPIITGLLAKNKTQEHPDFMAATVVMNAEALALTFCSILFAFDDETCQTMYEETQGREVLFAAIVDFVPLNRGRISLKSLDPLDSPDIYIMAYPSEEEYENLLDYVEDFARIVNTTHFKSVGGELVTLPQCAQYDKNSREYLSCYGRCMSSTYYHYCATCAMGEVVDSRLRVKGVQRLRVIDSSIMPTITSGTTNAPTMMIGEKGAAMIKEDNQ